MSVNYSAVVLIGVDYDNLTYEELTDAAKEMVREDVREASKSMYEINEYLTIINQDEVEKEWEAAAEELFNDNKLEICHEWFGFNGVIGNYFSGLIDYVGIEVILDQNRNYEKEVDQVMKYVKLKPDLHHGVLVS
jgi:hypothetical protein